MKFVVLLFILKPYAQNSIFRDKNIVIKGADKGFAVVVWDTEDCIKKPEKQLGYSDVYEEVPGDPEQLISTIHRKIEKIGKKKKFEK